MNRSFWLAALGSCLVFSALLGTTAAARATEAPALSVSAGESETERIRAIVREVMREYAASLGDRQATRDAKDIVREIVQGNRDSVRSHGPGRFGPFQDGQHPRATVVTCADARVHTHALDATPDGDLFLVRDIGNQIATAEGSVEYGVHHLHSPLLLIVGHAARGAIKVASLKEPAEH